MVLDNFSKEKVVFLPIKAQKYFHEAELKLRIPKLWRNFPVNILSEEELLTSKKKLWRPSSQKLVPLVLENTLREDPFFHTV